MPPLFEITNGRRPVRRPMGTSKPAIEAPAGLDPASAGQGPNGADAAHKRFQTGFQTEERRLSSEAARTGIEETTC